MPYVSPHNEDVGDLETGTRLCKLCQERKPMTEFQWTNQHRYRSRTCKSCVSARREALWDLHPEKKDRNTYVSRRSHLRNKYGLTPEEFDAMMEEQGGRCKICPTKFGTGRLYPHVDHDHVTGRVRGLLCFTCNTAIGKMNDDPALLRRAAQYLEGEL